MCGIVGLFLKNPALHEHLGSLLTEMLITMTDRGPDSAGIAVYQNPVDGKSKLTLQSHNPGIDFPELEKQLNGALDSGVSFKVLDTHAIVELAESQLASARDLIAQNHSDVRVMSAGTSIEIFKEVGLPQAVAERFELQSFAGTHGIGHTRMATESAVTTQGAHPFSTGPDQCLVHNGSLSNHNSLRRELKREGIGFETENDTEVAAGYLTHQMNQGKNLGDALQAGLQDLDGFYTFVVGTKNGFGVVRDPIACKPAVMAETDEYVAFGSEYRALVNLPSIKLARVWEPEPATVYFWEH